MRVLALVDSDSYIKWGAALLAQMPKTWERELALVATQLLPSSEQLDSALAASGFDRSTVRVLKLREVLPRIVTSRPDVVLVAMRGPAGSTIIRDIVRIPGRPVIVSGLPGISVPATWKALYYRGQSDLMVLHSKREIREFSELAASRGWDHGLALATLPFVDKTTVMGGSDIVFAAQAIVPREAVDRSRMLDVLIRTAERNPEHRIVIKVRANPGEHQTHKETFSYPDMLATMTDVPRNLVVSSGPMSDALERAAGLITVSSTAAIEAAARGLPVLTLDEFGVSDELINTVFIGSGLLAGEAACLELRLSRPRVTWLEDNYLHDPTDNNWLEILHDLLTARAEGRLPARRPLRDETGGALRRAWDRKRAFGPSDTSAIGVIALVVGMPARTIALSINRVRRLARRANLKG
jgi:hypothetical protein